jgi:hypothetical protein
VRSVHRAFTAALLSASIIGVFGCLAAHDATAANAATSSCVQSTPSLVVENNWAWGQTGSWGMPGQRLTYQFEVINQDAGCASSTFLLSVTGPAGFSVTIPTSAISLKSGTGGFLLASVTSPSVIVDGDYALGVSVQRAGPTTSVGASYSSATTYYKVYSSDISAPRLFLANPYAGQSISGHSFTMTVSSSDDHAVKSIDLYIDNTAVTTTACDDITYLCHLSYKWSLRGVAGPHTATFRSHDWMGNTGVLTVPFTVG